MKFAKSILTSFCDYPGSIATVVFTVGCNFRCPYCYNQDLVLERVETVSDQEALQEIFRRKITSSIVITGGEPTIHRDLPIFIRHLKKKGYSLKLDTNGSNPQMVDELLKEGLLDYVALDIKSSPENFQTISGLDESTAKEIFRRILDTLDLLNNSSVRFEIRTTFVPGLINETDLKEIKKIIGNKPWYIQRFKPYKTLSSLTNYALEEKKLRRLVDELGAELR